MIKTNELRIGNRVLLNEKEVIVNSVGEDWINVTFSEFETADGGLYDAAEFEFKEGEKYLKYPNFNQFPYESNNWQPMTLEGIPLAEELLLRFGFEYGQQEGVSAKNGANFYEKDNFKIHSEFLSGEWKLIYKTGEFNFIEVKYIHQLQNIFFALKGYDLEVIEKEEQ